MLVHFLSGPRRLIFEEQAHALVFCAAPNTRVLADFLPATQFAPLIDAELQGIKRPESIVEGCLGLIELGGREWRPLTST
mgnify:CR=1 FL=1